MRAQREGLAEILQAGAPLSRSLVTEVVRDAAGRDDQIVVVKGPTEVVTRRCSRSTPVTSARRTSTLRLRLTMVRTGLAIAEGSSSPDATWYRSG